MKDMIGKLVEGNDVLSVMRNALPQVIEKLIEDAMAGKTKSAELLLKYVLKEEAEKKEKAMADEEAIQLILKRIEEIEKKEKEEAVKKGYVYPYFTPLYEEDEDTNGDEKREEG